MGGPVLAAATAQLPDALVRVWGEVISVRQGEERWFIELVDARQDGLVVSASVPLSLQPPELGHSIGVEGQLRIRRDGPAIVTELRGTGFVTAGMSRRARERRALLDEVRRLVPPPLELGAYAGGLVVVVTSANSHAYGDFVRNLGPAQARPPIELRSVRLHEAAEVAQAITAAADRRDVGLIVLTRGGGDAGELSVFSLPEVVRSVAAAAARVPVVVGVGHASDWTLADEVASRSATTPTQAARLVAWAWNHASSPRSRRRAWRPRPQSLLRLVLAAVVVALITLLAANGGSLRRPTAPQAASAPQAAPAPAIPSSPKAAAPPARR